MVYRDSAATEPLLQLLSILRSFGWHRSISRRAIVNSNGEPLPFYTYPAIEWMTSRLRASDHVFEFGAGYSTLWYGRLTHEVVSVEDNIAWFRFVKAAFNQANVTIQHKATSGNTVESRGDSDYVSAIRAYPQKSFDVIVIDGMERVSCAFIALEWLRDDGIIVFDNSDRPWFRPGVEFLERAGLQRIDFFGFVPGEGTRECTSIFGRFPNRWTINQAPPDFQAPLYLFRAGS